MNSDHFCCYLDPAHDTPVCAIHDTVCDWSGELDYYRGPAGWICGYSGIKCEGRLGSPDEILKEEEEFEKEANDKLKQMAWDYFAAGLGAIELARLAELSPNSAKDEFERVWTEMHNKK